MRGLRAGGYGMKDKRWLTKFAREQLKKQAVEYKMVAFAVVPVNEVKAALPLTAEDQNFLQDLEVDELFLSKRV